MDDFGRAMDIMEGMAKKQDIQTVRTPSTHKAMPEYVVVKPGNLVSIELATIDLIEDDNLVTALENGMLSCQLILRRSGKNFFKTIKSKDLIMGTGLSPEKRNELISMSQK